MTWHQIENSNSQLFHWEFYHNPRDYVHARGLLATASSTEMIKVDLPASLRYWTSPFISFTNFLLISRLMPSSDVSVALPNIWFSRCSGTPPPVCVILHPTQSLTIWITIQPKANNILVYSQDVDIVIKSFNIHWSISKFVFLLIHIPNDKSTVSSVHLTLEDFILNYNSFVW